MYEMWAAVETQPRRPDASRTLDWLPLRNAIVRARPHPGPGTALQENVSNTARGVLSVRASRNLMACVWGSDRRPRCACFRLFRFVRGMAVCGRWHMTAEASDVLVRTRAVVSCLCCLLSVAS